MERIPVLIEQVHFLKQGQEETRQLIKDEVAELKSEHIMDIRKNVCRLWMAYDDTRKFMLEMSGKMDRMLGATEARLNMTRTIFGMLGAMAGALVTLVSSHYIK